MCVCPPDIGVMLWLGSEASRGPAWPLVLPVGLGFWRCSAYLCISFCPSEVYKFIFSLRYWSFLYILFDFVFFPTPRGKPFHSSGS